MTHSESRHTQTSYSVYYLFIYIETVLHVFKCVNLQAFLKQFIFIYLNQLHL